MRNLALLLALLFFVCRAHAIDYPPADGGVQIRLAGKVDVLVDQDGALTESQAWNSDKFQPATKLNFSYSSAAYWMRFSVRDSSYDILALEFDHPQIDDVRMTCRYDGQEMWQVSGDRLPFNARTIKVAKLVFPLPRTENFTCLVRVKTTSLLSLDGRITTIPDVYASAAVDNLISGGFFSVMILISIATAIASVAAKDYKKLSYSIGVVGFALWHGGVTGILYQYIWPTQIWLQNHLYAMAISMAYFGISAFVSTMLHPGKGRMIAITIAACWAAMIPVAMTDATWAIGRQAHTWLAIVYLLALPAITLVSWRRHKKSALRWVFFGQLCVIPPSIATVMLVRGAIPFSAWVGYAVLSGVLIEILMFVWALASGWMDSQQQALNMANAIADDRTRDLSAVVNAITHDVKNPADMIIKRANAAADTAPASFDSMANIVANARRIFLFASGVQWVEKNRSGLTIDLHEIDLSLIVAEVINDYRLQFQHQQIRLDNRMPPTLHVLGSAIYARNVVENLATNVLRHVGDGAVMRISASIDQDGVNLIIEDDGDGNLPKQKKQIGGLSSVEMQMRAMRGKASFGRSNTCGGLAAKMCFRRAV